MTEESSMQSRSGDYSIPKRRSKEISLAAAGDILAQAKIWTLSGSQTVNAAMALIRAGIKAGATGLTVIPPVDASVAVDMMIAAGVVDTVFVSYIGFETLGLAPAFRNAFESRTINVIEADEPFIVLGTRAAAGGLPFIPLKGVYEATDLLQLNPLLKRTTDPYTGEEVVTIPPLNADVCILHAQEADAYGNVQMWSGNQQEIDKAKSADIVIVSAERIISVDKSEANPHKVTVPGHLVTHVVHVPYGAHPTMSAGFYQNDEAHLQEYVKRIRKGQAEQYLQDYVYGPANHVEYLEKIGFDRLLTLYRDA